MRLLRGRAPLSPLRGVAAVVTRIFTHLRLSAEAPAIGSARGVREGGLLAGDVGPDGATGEEVARADAHPDDAFEVDRPPDDDEAPP